MACCSSTSSRIPGANALDSLRQTLETGEVAIARGEPSRPYPARFMLVAADPCRCGRAMIPGFACKAGQMPPLRRRLSERLSGPLLRRIICISKYPR